MKVTLYPDGRVEYQDEGVGDTVARLIHKTGLDRLTFGKDCGCEKRQETLNRLFPYK